MPGMRESVSDGLGGRETTGFAGACDASSGRLLCSGATTIGAGHSSAGHSSSGHRMGGGHAVSVSADTGMSAGTVAHSEEPAAWSSAPAASQPTRPAQVRAVAPATPREYHAVLGS